MVSFGVLCGLSGLLSVIIVMLQEVQKNAARGCIVLQSMFIDQVGEK